MRETEMEVNDVLLGLIVACQWVFMGLVALMVVEAVTATSNKAAFVGRMPHKTCRAINVSSSPQPIVKVPDVTPVVKRKHLGDCVHQIVLKKQSVESKTIKIDIDYMQFTKVELHRLCLERNLKRKSAYSKRELVEYLLQSSV
jgi:hypothetical protein